MLVCVCVCVGVCWCVLVCVLCVNYWGCIEGGGWPATVALGDAVHARRRPLEDQLPALKGVPRHRVVALLPWDKAHRVVTPQILGQDSQRWHRWWVGWLFGWIGSIGESPPLAMTVRAGYPVQLSLWWPYVQYMRVGICMVQHCTV